MNQKSYDDIINLPHPTSKKYSRMSLYDRAAQFSPYDALNRSGGVVCETAEMLDEINVDAGIETEHARTDM